MKLMDQFSIYEAQNKTELCGNTVPSSVFKTLRSKWPQFFPTDLVGFHLRAEAGEPVVSEVVSFLSSTGRQPYWQMYPELEYGHSTFYQIEGKRVWEPADFDTNYFCWVVADKAGNGRPLAPDSLFEVDFSSYRGKKIGGMLNYGNPFCSVEYRKELEAQNFKGLTFRPVKIKSRKPEKLVLWQPWSSITLPPVLNKVVGLEGEPFDPAKSKICSVDDIYYPPHYRFPVAKVAKLEPFDIALTTEHWGGSPAHLREPAIIVSRRFCEWFMTQNVPVNWWPVALENERTGQPIALVMPSYSNK